MPSIDSLSSLIPNPLANHLRETEQQHLSDLRVFVFIWVVTFWI